MESTMANATERPQRVIVAHDVITQLTTVRRDSVLTTAEQALWDAAIAVLTETLKPEAT